MNTEQLKTADQILKQQMIKLLKKEQPEWTDKEVEEMVEDDLASETDFVEHFIEAMQIFASQESKRAVDEFKEKLENELLNARLWVDAEVNKSYIEHVLRFIKKL